MKVRDKRKQDWFWVDNEVVDLIGECLGTFSLVTYIALARITDNNTQASFPSLNTIARRVGLSRSTVKRALKTLEEFSIVHSQSRLTVSGDPDTNEYFLVDLSEWKKEAMLQNRWVGSVGTEVGSDRPEVGSMRTEGGVSRNRGVGSVGTPIKTNREQDLIKEDSSCAERSALAPANPSALNGHTAKKARAKRDVPAEALRLAEQLRDSIQANSPHTLPKSEAKIREWAAELDKIHRIDGKSWEQIAWLLAWSQQDAFWSGVILSAGGLRRNWDQLLLKAQKAQPKHSAPVDEHYEDDFLRLAREDREKKQRQAQEKQGHGSSTL